MSTSPLSAAAAAADPHAVHADTAPPKNNRFTALFTRMSLTASAAVRPRKVSLSTEDISRPDSMSSSAPTKSPEQNTALIEMILKNEEQNWSTLIRANGAVSTSVELFTLLEHEIRSAILAEDIEKRDLLLAFCQAWVEANRWHASYSAARSQFEAIVAMTDQTRLGESLNTTIYEDPVRDFRGDCIPAIVGNSLEEAEHAQLVSQVASDLTQKQIDLYCKLDSHALLRNTWREPPLNMQEHMSYFNQTAFFFAESILLQKDLEQRRRLCAFFFAVALKCFDKNDLVSTRIIWTTFDCGPVSRLKTTLSPVFTKYQEKYDFFKQLFASENNFPAYRRYHKRKFASGEPFIPDPTLALKDVLFTSEQTFSSNTSAKDARISETVTQFLGLQSAWRATRSVPLVTNINNTVSTYVPDEDYYYELSYAIEPNAAHSCLK